MGKFLLQVDNKFCESIKREHKSNRLFITLDIMNNKYWIHCRKCQTNSEEKYIIFNEDFEEKFSTMKIN